jgi:hypothetical protein
MALPAGYGGGGGSKRKRGTVARACSIAKKVEIGIGVTVRALGICRDRLSIEGVSLVLRFKYHHIWHRLCSES